MSIVEIRPSFRVVWHWITMGAYHFARMAALARRPEIDLTVVETACRDDHAWTRAAKPDSFRLVTLSNEPLDGMTFRRTRREYSCLLNQVHPDVIIECGYFEPYARQVLHGYRRHHPAVLNLFWSETCELDHRRRYWRESLKGYLLRFFDGALVAGRPHSRYLQRLGMPIDRIAIIGGCVDNSFFQERALYARQQAELRRKLDLPDHYFLYIGRFIEAKNLLFLLQAFARYRELVGEGGWELVMVGGGPQEGMLRDWVAKKRVPGVWFAGIRQPCELPEFYAFASCFVLPSNSEPWGLVVNEAMACGLAVLVSNKCGCAEDLVEHGWNGFLFDPSEVEDLAGMFAKVSSGSIDLGAMGRRGLEKVAEFTVDRYAEETVSHLSRLLLPSLR